MTAVDDETPPSAPEEKTVQGLYMFGGVGCGKTMLMDLFILSSPPRFKVKRVHFHDFMLDIHARLRRHARERDPLVRVAEEYLRSCRVLCLDELMVTDVADAMILHRLFDQFWAQGLVLVSTSNRPPDGLYENGLQRALFLPFIRELKERCVVRSFGACMCDVLVAALVVLMIIFLSMSAEKDEPLRNLLSKRSRRVYLFCHPPNPRPTI